MHKQCTKFNISFIIHICYGFQESWPKSDIVGNENSSIDPEVVSQSETNSFQEGVELEPNSPFKKEACIEEDVKCHSNVMCDSASDDWSEKP